MLGCTYTTGAAVPQAPLLSTDTPLLDAAQALPYVLPAEDHAQAGGGQWDCSGREDGNVARTVTAADGVGHVVAGVRDGLAHALTSPRQVSARRLGHVVSKVGQLSVPSGPRHHTSHPGSGSTGWPRGTPCPSARHTCAHTRRIP